MKLAGFLATHERIVQVRISHVEGSSPREVGAWMCVSDTGSYGTIGGGQLEYMAQDRARQMLKDDAGHTQMDVPLGPDIGQCCGGRVLLTLSKMDDAARHRALAAEAQAEREAPEVLVFGAGHVGRALVRAMAPLPVRLRLVDSRAEELGLADCMNKCLTPLPESMVSEAGPGAAFVIATHDHALDFLLAAAALDRGDAAYVGMIGSESKRAKFSNWARRHGGVDAGPLVCPMGRAGLGDKRPEVIAAFIAAEVLTALSRLAKVRLGTEAPA